jgi:phosphoglycolate phosphatase
MKMNLLFDLDGTLTDPFLGIAQCISYSLTRLGRKPPPKASLGCCIGPPLKESFAKLLGSEDETLVDTAVLLFRERFASIGLFENKPYEDVKEVLEILQEKGHTLYVATLKPEIFAKRIVNHFHLEQYFKKVYGSELDGTRGDKTSLIGHILQKESISLSDAFMIGDRKQDMIGAKSNGITGIGVLWGYGTKEELEISGADTCIKTPRDLITALS